MALPFHGWFLSFMVFPQSLFLKREVAYHSFKRGG
jgi:hypothetical protein